MKYDFLQGDFSAGEITRRSWGHVESDAFKAGLALAANCIPTRGGSVASRAGGKLVVDGLDAHSGGLSNMPVQHVLVKRGPSGPFVLEVSPTGMRMLDGGSGNGTGGGVIPWNFTPPSQLVQYVEQDGTYSYGDAKTRSIYMRSDVGHGTSYYLTKGSGANNALLSRQAGLPAGTSEQWSLNYKLAGDNVSMVVVQSPSGNQQTFNLVAGWNLQSFTPNIGGPLEDFYIRFDLAAGSVKAATFWECQLTKNGSVFVTDTTALLPAPSFLGAAVPPTQERVRADSFWVSQDNPYKGALPVFYVAFAGGPANSYAGYCLTYTQVGTAPGIWTFGLLPCAPGSLAMVQGSNSVAVYQDRLWFGNNKALGRPMIVASHVGFVQFFDAEINGGAIGTKAILFTFKVVEETYVVTGAEPTATNPSASKIMLIPFHVQAADPLVDTAWTSFQALNTQAQMASPAAKLSVKINGLPVKVSPAAVDYLAWSLDTTSSVAKPEYPGIVNGAGTTITTAFECWAVWPFYRPAEFPTRKSQAMGFTAWMNKFGGALFGPRAGDVITFSTIAAADNPLNLTLASPTGDVAWLNVLRGLVLGTTENEKLFSQDTPLAIDPASGQVLSLNDESNLGGDPSLGALNVNDKILFVQQGRQVLRMAGISIASNGGLISEDVGELGEHLTKLGVRDMCFLKSPTPRVVLAFDDGSGAVLTLRGRVGEGAAWSRFTLPAVFGGIYSVEALNGPYGSELWVGTENGSTLWWQNFESDTKTGLIDVPQPIVTGQAAPLHVVFGDDDPLPPVMDGWYRVPIFAATQYITGLTKSYIGQNVYVYVRGQVFGPFPVVSDPLATHPGKVDLSTIPGIGTTWVDKNGNRRGQEVYVGLAYDAHRWTSLPLEGGDPTGSAQAQKSRKAQLYLRFVDSYMPKVNGTRPPERGPGDLLDLLGARVTGDVRCTEMGFTRGAQVDVIMDLPLRMEVAAMFGGTQVNIL